MTDMVTFSLCAKMSGCYTSFVLQSGQYLVLLCITSRIYVSQFKKCVFNC